MTPTAPQDSGEPTHYCKCGKKYCPVREFEIKNQALTPVEGSGDRVEAILDGLMDYSPSRGQRQMKDGSVRHLTGEQVRYEAKAAIELLLLEARIDELKTLMAKHTRTYTQTVTDSNGDVYVDDSHGYISKYETQERLADLQSNLQKGKV